MTFNHNARVGYGGAIHKVHRKKAPDSSCTTGGFYKSPSSGQSVESGTSLDISWDTTCLTSDAVDIYLYAPGSSSSRIHMWENVNYALGSYSSELSAGWWNSSGSISLQLSIVESGTPPFLSTLPAGPVFTATVGSGDKSSGSTVSSSIQDVNNFSTPHTGPSKGKVAAAVIFPLLIVGGLITAAWLKFNRAKTEEKRKRWSEAVDKRMSTISTDWKSISPAGASAAIRNSMAASGISANRSSAFSFGNIRPSSTIALEGGQAGIGTKAMSMQENGNFETPQMSQLRPNARLSAADRLPRVSFAADTRVSRVSFATDTRPSSEYRRGVSRAFHFGDVPPLPEPSRQDSSEMSPTQTHGPLALTPDDIRARMTGQSEAHSNIDDYMPALSMMRHGGEGGANENDLLFTPQEPTPPTPIVPKSSIVGIMPMQPMPANVMSPDEMLRAYAESRRAMGPPGSSSPAFPSPTLSYDGNGMRTLYSPPPSTPVTPYGMNRPISASSRYDDDDAYMGTAN
jgi:hypothetical protein